ncbi:yemanuclein isoform X2 [Phlebotomus papatasi]|uniref:yemanuclein isoform X2 n=1 Tax=Phlebotomus papatasi TaxID=29031 RepID=UPI0024834F91|nr:yemanuclein isoform X2 [Phlebotomus papatasi]
MSEAKRAPIATIGDVDKEKKAGNTVRLELKLFEPNADTFPEFNYQALLHAEKKKRKKISKLNGFAAADAFDNDDDVARIAKELEKKYGSNSGYGKKHSSKSTGDYCDKGAGYDESDSFIDNTEAYDELIPDEIETVRGGFYINSGPLEFQHLSNYERPEDAQRMPKPKKRALSTSSSSSDEEAEESSVPKGTQEASKNGHQDKKLKSATVVDESKIKATKVTKPPPPPAATEKKAEPKVKSDSERGLKTTTVKDMLRAKRDNLRNMQDAASKRDSEADGIELSSAPMTSESSNESTAVEMPNGTGGVKPEAKLPANLSEDLLRNIVLLKEAARVSTNLGKTNFFDSKVQDILLQIENATRAAGGHTRNQVYSYLESHLPCSKQTLMLRAKKLRIQQEEAKVKRAVSRLKKAVEECMPGLISAYEKEYERVQQLKNSMTIMGIPEKENDTKWPKKQFVWTETTKGLLNAIVNACRSAFGTIKSRKETVEDYVLDCLKMDVLLIWPIGWMKLEGLLKEMEWKIDMRNVTKNVAKDGGGSGGGNDVRPVVATSVIKNVGQSEKVAETKVVPVSSAATSFPVSSSLTITPVSATASAATKPLPSIQNKVTITNVEAVPKILPPAKVSTVTSSAAVATPQLPSGLSISITSSPSSIPPTPAPPPPPVASSTTSSATKTASKSPPKEATPPPKKSFDYSISSIISSTTSTNPTPNPPPPAPAPVPAPAPAPAPVSLPNPPPSLTIEVEKSKPPVISVEEKPKAQPEPPAHSPTSAPIKVRSVANVNNSVPDKGSSSNSSLPAPKPQEVIFEELSSTSSESDSDTDSSSDCEIIESSPDVKMKKSAGPTTTSQAIKRPTKPQTASSSGASVVQRTRDLDPLSLANDNDIDVNQIMKELKELQEFHQDSRPAPGFNSKKPSDISEYSKTAMKKRKKPIDENDVKGNKRKQLEKK